MNRFFLSLLSLGVFWLAAAMPALQAQGTGSVVGVVQDESEGVIPGVEVRLINNRTGVEQVRVTDNEGRFRFPRVPVGDYRIEAELTGFSRFVSGPFKLDVDATRTADVVLQVGEVSQTVTVSGAVTQVATEGATLMEVVDQKRIEELPLNGRNALQLQLLVAGTNTAPGIPSLSENSGYSINGSRAISNNYLLDGGDHNDPLSNSAAVTPNPDSLAEFSVLTNNFSAEYGRNTGAVINAVTKSGTNQFHGSLYEFHRNDALDAKDFFALQKGKLIRNQFGGTIGGPIARDKAFFFFSYEGLRERKGATFSGLTVPTQLERAGDFSQSARKPIDPQTGQPFPNDTIPANRLDQASLNFLDALIPLPNAPNNRHVFNRPQNEDGDQFVARVDAELSDRQRLFGRFFLDQTEQSGTLAAQLPALTSAVAFETWSVAGNHTYTFSPNLLNSAQFTYGKSLVDRGPQPAAGGVSYQDFGVNVNRGAPNDQVEEFGLVPHYRGRVSGFWNLNQINLVAIDRKTFQWKDDVSWISGAHSVKFGGEFRKTSNDRVTANAVDPQFNFTGTFTNNAFADFMIGRSARMLQRSLRINALRGEAFAFYVQDDFQMTQNVTLSMGLRWEPFIPFTDVHIEPSQVSLFRPGLKSTLFPNAPQGLVYGGDLDGQIPLGGVDSDWNNLAPRVGIAWSPRQGTSVRAGYGIFYDAPRYFTLSNFVNTAPFTLQVVLRDVQFSDPWAGREDPYPYVIPAGDEARRNVDFLLPVSYGLNVDSNLVAAYSQQWNLNLQQQLGDYVFTVAYVGMKATNLPISRENNPALFQPGATLGNVDARRIHAPNFASILTYSPIGFSTYNALQLTVNKRFSQGYTILANYTYGRTIDNSSNDGGFAGQDPLNPVAAKGLADFHLKHRLNTSFLWELPSVGSGVADAVLGGWQLNGILSLQSGSPFNIVTGRDIALTGTGTQRPNQIGNPELDTDRSRAELIQRYYDPAAFAVPESGTFGNVGRNTLIGPGFWNFDFAVFKRFEITESTRLEFRTELFNAFNHANLGNPSGNVTSSRAGVITGTSPARVMQFGLKLIY